MKHISRECGCTVEADDTIAAMGFASPPACETHAYARKMYDACWQAMGGNILALATLVSAGLISGAQKNNTMGDVNRVMSDMFARLDPAYRDADRLSTEAALEEVKR